MIAGQRTERYASRYFAADGVNNGYLVVWDSREKCEVGPRFYHVMSYDYADRLEACERLARDLNGSGGRKERALRSIE